MPNSNIPGNTSRRLIDRGRIDELRRYGWRVVGAAPYPDDEWSVVMAGDLADWPSHWGAGS